MKVEFCLLYFNIVLLDFILIRLDGGVRFRSTQRYRNVLNIISPFGFKALSHSLFSHRTFPFKPTTLDSSLILLHFMQCLLQKDHVELNFYNFFKTLRAVYKPFQTRYQSFLR